MLKLLLLPVLFAQIDFDIFESDFGPATIEGDSVVFTDVDLADHFVDSEGPRISEAYLDIDLFPPGNWRVVIGGEATIATKGPAHFLEAENYFNVGLTVPVEPAVSGPWLYRDFVIPVLDRLELLSTLDATEGDGHMDVDSLELQYVGDYLIGDWNYDLKVDAADYVVWRDQLGKHRLASERQDWRRMFGETLNAVAAIPEPNTLAISAWLIGLAAIRYRRRGEQGLGT